MKGWTIFKRENLEYWRNYKWIWVPLVFILLGISDPLSTYYLPQIIESVGGMPEGSSFEIPTPEPGQVMMMTLGQFSQLGVLVIALMTMGLISGERKSGVSELIMVKPVPYRTYVVAKWASTLMLVLISYGAGLLMSWYYINLLFGELSVSDLIRTFVFYGLWLMLVVTVSVFVNTLFKVPGLVGFLTILILIASSIVTSVFSHVLDWSPNKLSAYIHDMLLNGSIPDDLWGAAFTTVGIVLLLLIGSVFTFKTKEMA